jgi:hypothetical protein
MNPNKSETDEKEIPKVNTPRPYLLIRPHEVLSGIFHWLVLEKAFNPFRRLCQVSHVVVGGSA